MFNVDIDYGNFLNENFNIGGLDNVSDVHENKH